MRSKKPLQLALFYALPFVLIATALFLFLLFWERRDLAKEQQDQLTHTASAVLDQIIVTRLWNAEHGGVYVEITDKTRPNPYLEDPRRDITALTGKRYTKINPAYMTRQIAELSRSHLGYRFNITSLKPLNPSNQPDPWEDAALRSFENGAEQMAASVLENGKPVFRYMVPLPTEQSCLACHAKQHYKVGDIRGGISVTIPREESDILYQARTRRFLAAGVVLWLSIVVFIVLVSYTLSRKVVREMTRELEHSRLRTAVELAGAAAHEIRQPLTALITYFDILKMKLAHDPALLKDLDMMITQCRRIDEIISGMKGLTEYRTKSYVNEIRITDLHKAGRNRDPEELH